MAELVLSAPLRGWTTALDDVPDAVFAERMLGDGMAIDPVGDMLHAPCDAVVATIHAAAHAITLRTAEGAEILMHVGIDTVGLAGEGFAPRVSAGQAVRRGDPLIGFDLDLLVARVPSLVTPIVVTNGDRFTILRRCEGVAVEVGDPLMTLVPVGREMENAAPAGVQHSRSIRVPLVHGIHARPAARIGAAVKDLDAVVALVRDGERGDVRSAIAILALGIRCGDTITIEASGADAAVAVATIAALIEGGMGEAAPPAPPPRPAPRPRPAVPPAEPVDVLPAGMLRGVTAAPGLAMGAAFRLRRAELAVAERGGEVADERIALDAAIAAVRTAIGGVVDGAAGAIMAAHLALLDDPALHAAASEHVATGASAGQAWRLATRAQADLLAASRSARMAERADDLLDLEDRVLRALAGVEAAPVTVPPGCVLVADDLLPSQLLALDTRAVAAICVARGGPTSHVAILAAGLGLPMLVAIGPALDAVADGTPLVVHADTGRLAVAPAPDAIAVVEAQLAVRAARSVAASAAAMAECRTRDGIRIEVFANCGSLADAEVAVANGAEGCGLLRTEFLFLERAAAPAPAEQAGAYQRIADALAGRPLIVRLLDIGGDKPAAYLPMPREENPALGLRGIRVGMANRELLAAQLRGILAVLPVGQCRIMIPMVASLGELRAVRSALDALRTELGIVAAVELGIMVETPAAAITADLLAAEADFLSIGTNDLTQYTLAMDRANPAVAHDVDGLHPAVLRLIGETCRGAATHRRWTGVCGGLASDPLAVPILIGLGVTELSAIPQQVPAIKALVRTLPLDACTRHARAALAAPSAGAVRALAATFARDLDGSPP